LGANPNSYNCMPPLHAAVSLREPVLTCLLLSYGADPDLRAREDGATALHHADTKSIPGFHDSPRSDVTSYVHYLPDNFEPVDTEDTTAVVARVKSCVIVLIEVISTLLSLSIKNNLYLL
jgi:hypothetical protein